MFKSTIRKIVPYHLRSFIWNSIPKVHLVNTYLLKCKHPITDLYPINKNYFIRLISRADEEKLREFHRLRSNRSFKYFGQRIKSPDWFGLAIIDKSSDDIAYLAWIIERSIPYLEEFNINMQENQFLLKDGYCLPKYRHQGLHTRMEQERINYCINKGANEIFIQIHDLNKKGITSVLNNGYELFQKDNVIQWPIFRVYRAFNAFLKKPFRKVVK